MEDGRISDQRCQMVQFVVCRFGLFCGNGANVADGNLNTTREATQHAVVTGKEKSASRFPFQPKDQRYDDDDDDD